MSNRYVWMATMLGLLGCGGSGESQLYEVQYTETRDVCGDRNPLRNAYFGDTHVHTGFSFDAYTQEVRVTPDDAYRFARGEQLLLPPLDSQGNGTTPVALDTPLDFVAVTDHAEFFGEVQVCSDPSAPGYNAPECVAFRTGRNSATFQFGIELSGNNPSRFDFCDDEESACTERAQSIWARTQEAAEAAYDRTSRCSFTSFVGYEYSAATNVSNLHRNVIFRTGAVPAVPTSYYEQPSRAGLWRELDEKCLQAGIGCDVLAIPHNSNLSNGNLFAPEYPRGYRGEQEREALRLRAKLEPLFEIYQHKSDSECMNGLSGALGVPDEMCDFEKYHTPDTPDCEGVPGSLGISGGGCVDAQDFIRNVLVRGMEEEARTGVNPYKLGLLAATDTHNGTPGAVSESDWVGHVGVNDVDLVGRMEEDTLPPGGWRYSPGGLTGIWAQENSRDALFMAMQRREVWGTSGPRIVPRFFGGWDLPTNLCNNPNFVELGYDLGVPMGSDMRKREGVEAPRFVVSALRQPDVDGALSAPLEKIQIVKGWVDTEGQTGVQVYDVAIDSTGTYALDTATCQVSGSGADSLCGEWQDPDFDPTARAYYYVRVLEYPTCRWNKLACLGSSEQDRAPECDREDIPTVIRERAWTSPIWYSGEES